MKTKCIMSAPYRDELLKMINEFYCTKSYIITEDMRAYNTKTEKYMDGYIIEYKHGRWYYSRIEEEN